ncbi:Alpha/Beta hydrolase protein [Spinellus fusiger]|nr:Alpha/Beta hydrolase protein [Spinellus fusiger]
MSYLVPTSTHIIPVSPKSRGYDIQKLSVDKHVFSSPKTTTRTFAFLWSHSTGFHKESLHTLMKSHLKTLREDSNYDHTEVHYVSWDARSHGDSARLNENTFFKEYSWMDNAMDIQQVIQMMKLDKNYDNFIGIGHSFGATSMLLLEYIYPNTFDGLCVIEPVLASGVLDVATRSKSQFFDSIKRRDTWPSKELALSSLKGGAFWKTFHPEVLENYVNYGMYDSEDGTVKLKCPKEEEYKIFVEGYYSISIAYNSLVLISIPLCHIICTKSTFITPEYIPIASQKDLIMVEKVEGGHMVPNEDPDRVGK